MTLYKYCDSFAFRRWVQVLSQNPYFALFSITPRSPVSHAVFSPAQRRRHRHFPISNFRLFIRASAHLFYTAHHTPNHSIACKSRKNNIQSHDSSHTPKQKHAQTCTRTHKPTDTRHTNSHKHTHIRFAHKSANTA